MTRDWSRVSIVMTQRSGLDQHDSGTQAETRYKSIFSHDHKITHFGTARKKSLLKISLRAILLLHVAYSAKVSMQYEQCTLGILTQSQASKTRLETARIQHEMLNTSSMRLHLWTCIVSIQWSNVWKIYLQVQAWFDVICIQKRVLAGDEIRYWHPAFPAPSTQAFVSDWGNFQEPTGWLTCYNDKSCIATSYQNII